TPTGSPCNVASPTPTATGTPSPSPTATATATATATPTATPTATSTPSDDVVTKTTEQYGVGQQLTAGQTVLQWNIYTHSTGNPRKAVIIIFGGHWNSGNRDVGDNHAREQTARAHHMMT